MTDVKCKVQSCYYWKTGDICQADSIMVDNNPGRSIGMETGSLDFTGGSTGSKWKTGSDQSRGRTSDFEAGTLDTGSLGDTHRGQGTRSGSESGQAKTSHETLCSTFRPKGSQPKH